MKKTEPEGKMRRILVQGAKNFVLEIPADIRLTFGPWSPPRDRERQYGDKALTGTLRLYRGTTTAQNIVAMYTGVESFRDLDLIIYSEKHPIPICKLCKSNLVVPGDDLCRSCSGQAEEPFEGNTGIDDLTVSYSRLPAAKNNVPF